MATAELGAAVERAFDEFQGRRVAKLNECHLRGLALLEAWRDGASEEKHAAILDYRQELEEELQRMVEAARDLEQLIFTAPSSCLNEFTGPLTLNDYLDYTRLYVAAYTKDVAMKRDILNLVTSGTDSRQLTACTSAWTMRPYIADGAAERAVLRQRFKLAKQRS